ncbi:MAG: type VI secretion system baseplate subunit TssF, partial [Gammaproteobacteria bacterium]|nr:type VI secretion system baseplate subunit TssF [Gammaproteobacteria bacterium]
LRMEGIQTSKVEPINLVLQGVAVRGIRINLTANSSKFTCEGELYMLSQVLNRFFAKFSTINSFTQLWVEDIEKGDIYKWKPMNGQQVLL